MAQPSLPISVSTTGNSGSEYPGMSCGLACTSHGIQGFTLRYLLSTPSGPISNVALNTAPGYFGSCSMKLPVCTYTPFCLQKRRYGAITSSGRSAVCSSNSFTVVYIGAQCANSGNTKRRTSWKGAYPASVPSAIFTSWSTRAGTSSRFFKAGNEVCIAAA